MEMETEQEVLGFLQKYESRIMWGLVIFAVLAMLTVLGIYIYHFGNFSVQNDPEKWGPFGDYFGGVLNPILAFLAFLILMMSFRLQSKELRETRLELTAARAAQEQASKAQMQQALLAEMQIKQVDRQNFESLFFKLIELSNQTFKSTEIKVTEPDLRNGATRTAMYGGVGGVENKLFQLYCGFNNNVRVTNFLEYKWYVKSVINILKTIDSWKLTTKNGGDEYADIFINYLSQHQLRVIFYYYGLLSEQYIMNGYGHQTELFWNEIINEINLIEKYTLLINLDLQDDNTLQLLLYQFQMNLSIDSATIVNYDLKMQSFIFKLLENHKI